MDISVKELTSVDKEVTVKSNREDLQAQFDKAFKRYQGKITLPGFRPGHVPLSLVKKRFGKEIEFEEINKYVQTIFEKDIVPAHEPVGETQMLDLQWENDVLEVSFKIGTKPELELIDLKTVKVNKMVHDVTDEEVNEEINRTLENQGNWEEIDSPAPENSKITADVVSLDADGNEIEGEKDIDQVIDLRQEAVKDFKAALTGKKIGDVVDMKLEEGEEKDHFRVTIKKVEVLHKAELDDAFIKENSRGEATTEDELKSFIKSNMQQYYDQTANDLFKNDVVESLVEAHTFEVPDTFVEQVKTSYIEQLKQQYDGNLPEGFTEETYRAQMTERAIRDAKWYFISQKLQDTFDDIEITPEDIDEFLGVEAARYGMVADQLKSYYAQNPGMLEQLRTSIRENKVFDKLQDVVEINEIDKDTYRKLQDEKHEHEHHHSHEHEHGHEHHHH